jgi:predicted nucleotide-binding protein
MDDPRAVVDELRRLRDRLTSDVREAYNKDPYFGGQRWAAWYRRCRAYLEEHVPDRESHFRSAFNSHIVRIGVPEKVAAEHDLIRPAAAFIESLCMDIEEGEVVFGRRGSKVGIPSAQSTVATKQGDSGQAVQAAVLSTTTAEGVPVTSQNRKVFVVHGHDVPLRYEVAELLRKAGLNPVVLHEQANSGATVIEKLERETDVMAAVVLLTPDDEGRVRGKAGEGRGEGDPPLAPRARQNVVFEWGMLCGKLGRSRVFPLAVEGVEIPSDMAGAVWINLRGQWRQDLCKELKRAGLDIDVEGALL